MVTKPTHKTQLEAANSPTAKPVLNGPKRQHFLPRFYLDGFANAGMLAVYDRETNEVRVQQPVNTGVIGHFYTFEDNEGRKRFELEQMLSEFEAKASSCICKLTAKQEISPDERADLAIFVALAAFRTPDIVDSLKLFNSGLIGDMTKSMFANVGQVKERMRGKPSSPTIEDDLEKEAKEIVEFVKSGQYEITTSHRWAIGMAMQMAFSVAPLLAGRNWVVIYRDSDKKSFVTTDAPVVLSTITPREPSIYGVGFGNADAMVTFPLTQSCALVMYGQEGDFQHRAVGAEQIRHCNLALADRCQRFVIGREDVLVGSLAHFLGLAGKKWMPKMQRN
jgi:hypothetical protein